MSWFHIDPYYRASAIASVVPGCAGLHNPGVPVEYRDDVVELVVTKWAGHKGSKDGRTPRFYVLKERGWSEYLPSEAQRIGSEVIVLGLSEARDLHQSLGALLNQAEKEVTSA